MPKKGHKEKPSAPVPQLSPHYDAQAVNQLLTDPGRYALKVLMDYERYDSAFRWINSLLLTLKNRQVLPIDSLLWTAIHLVDDEIEFIEKSLIGLSEPQEKSFFTDVASTEYRDPVTEMVLRNPGQSLIENLDIAESADSRTDQIRIYSSYL